MPSTGQHQEDKIPSHHLVIILPCCVTSHSTWCITFHSLHVHFVLYMFCFITSFTWSVTLHSLPVLLHHQCTLPNIPSRFLRSKRSRKKVMSQKTSIINPSPSLEWSLLLTSFIHLFPSPQLKRWALFGTFLPPQWTLNSLQVAFTISNSRYERRVKSLLTLGMLKTGQGYMAKLLTRAKSLLLTTGQDCIAN